MQLDSPIESILGVGPAYARALRSHSINTVLDLIKQVPARYLDFSHITSIAEVRPGQLVTVAATVIECNLERTPRKHMFLVRARVKDAGGEIGAIWFNQPYLKEKLKPGTVLRLCGVALIDPKVGLTLRNPIIQFSGVAMPEKYYSKKTGVESGKFARLIEKTTLLIDEITDPLPAAILSEFNLPSLSVAYKELHFPQNMEDISEGKTRLALDELWSLMLITGTAKKIESGRSSIPITIDSKLLKQDVNDLPFKLTKGQVAVLDQICQDVSRRSPMRRLLNGDVGSGKTVVAFLVAKQSVASGHSAVFLAPTTVLAMQHYQNWRLLYPNVPSFLFTGSLNLVNGEKQTRAEAIKLLKESGPGIICGTHAIFQSEVDLHHSVGFVIVDEQHRFGVMQRARLINSQNGSTPHLLSMSATPIPRTAALVLYGDLDVSVLPEKPHDRKTIVTKLASEKSREMAYKFVDQLIEKGQQAYVICPLIGLDADDDVEMGGRLVLIEERKALLDEYEKLTKTVFAHRRLGMLHGRMKQQEKDDVLMAFRKHDLDILVSTSVVEVGVDVANATAMVIESAEFFGLAQLHQLRGRVGRGVEQSFCFLFASNWTQNTKKRLEMLVQYHDGFTLAEKDLELRGPGEIYGTMQAGFAPFKFASLGNLTLVEKAKHISERLSEIGEDKWPVELKNWINERRQIAHIE